MTATIIRGDARHLPLPDGSVDLVVTSPPYWALRSYTDGGSHYQGQLGSEATPQEFVAALVECVAEMVRVLKPSGSIFLNLGDKYAAGHGGRSTMGTGDIPRVNRNRPAAQHWAGADSHPSASRAVIAAGTMPKSLMGLPWRVALACTDQLGLILRAEIVWAKPNGLPESVGDRVRRAHEQVFHFTRQPRYYAAVDEIREPQFDEAGPPSRFGRLGANGGNHGGKWLDGGLGTRPEFGGDEARHRDYNPLGKLPGSVWTIPSAPLTVPPHLGVDHFAAFPPALVRPIVLGWSPAGICTACGEGRRPVSTARYTVLDRFPDRRSDSMALNGTGTPGSGQWEMTTRRHGRAEAERTITGYVCACATPTAPTRPAIVLDPFSGTGTVPLVASVYGRQGIGVDLSHDYCRLAQWRVADPGERARALDVPKPPPVPEGMDVLF